ncbi:hypothetical protein Tco_1259165 [Tanacetum coccineum]
MCHGFRRGSAAVVIFVVVMVMVIVLSLGKEVRMDFENSAVCLPSNEGGLENTLMESRSLRDDLYGSLFQQSGSVETQVLLSCDIHPAVYTLYSSFKMLAAPCEPSIFLNNGGVTTVLRAYSVQHQLTNKFQLIGLQSADPQSRPFIAANQEGKHFSFVDSLLDPNLWYDRERHGRSCNWLLGLLLVFRTLRTSLSNLLGHLDSFNGHRLISTDLCTDHQFASATVTNAQQQHGIDPEKDSGED